MSNGCGCHGPAVTVPAVDGEHVHLSRVMRVIGGSQMLGRLATSYSWTPFLVILAGYTVVQVRYFGTDFGQWDILLLSAWATVAIGLAVAQTLPGRLHHTLVRVADRGALDVSEARLGDVFGKLRARAATWGWWVGAFVALAIGAAFSTAFRGGLGDRMLLVVLAVIAGYAAGFQLGRMASYGRVGSILRQAGAHLRVTPGHLDGVGGLKPIGEYFLFQAMVAAIPAVFLATWWVLIPLRGERYERWRDPYLGLLVIAIVLELLAFIAPMWFFHREMVAQKADLLREADRLSREIASLSKQVASAAEDEAGRLRERMTTVTERYWALENLPTWPVDVKTRRRFRLNNLALFLPLVGKFIGESPLWQDFANVLTGFGD